MVFEIQEKWQNVSKKRSKRNKTSVKKTTNKISKEKILNLLKS